MTDDMPREEPFIRDDVAALKAALEHVCRHDSRSLVSVRVGVGADGALEALVTSCGPDGISEERDLRILRALIPELTDLVRAIIGRREKAGEALEREGRDA